MINHGLGDWIHRRRIKSKGRTALISSAGELTYDELDMRINRLANALADRGVRPGDRVAYLGENSPAFLETLFATGSLGAVFVPLNTRSAPPEVRFVLQDSGARLLITSDGLQSVAVSGSKDTEIERLVIVHADAGESRQERGAAGQAEDFEQMVFSAGSERPRAAVGHDDLAVILYTSGTTGSPKGAMLTHGNLTWNALNVLTDFDLTSRDVALMISPLFHVAALGQGVLPVLLKGGTIVLEQGFEPGRALRLIEQHQVTNISGVPTTFQLLCEHPEWDSTDISTLRTLTCGGSAVPLRILEAYEERGLSFTMGYGMTETSPGVTTLPPAYSRSKQGSGGLPHFHTEVRVVDPLGEVPAPSGEAGEIHVQGPNVVREYWNRPEATESSFVSDEDGLWFRTGDMGYVDEDGFLFISDRLKDMIISGGENIYPAQVEQEIAQLGAVAGVAVIGVEHDKWGEVPKAIVVLRNDYELTEQQIIDFLDGKLARYKIPKSVAFVDELPRTASGKIRKPDLRKKYA